MLNPHRIQSSPNIPLSLPETGEPGAAAARRVILSGWLTMGPETAAFENEFAAAVGAPQACAVSSGTTALHLALLAAGVSAGVSAGDEVVTVSHSFIATASAVRYCGAVPVFIEVEPATFNIAPERIEAAISPRTRAILCPHQMGMPCDLAAILPLARRHGLPVIEDAACAAGSEVLHDGKWQRIGRTHGDIACFSFHPRKVLTTGDGGCSRRRMRIGTGNSGCGGITARAACDQSFRHRRLPALAAGAALPGDDGPAPVPVS